MTKVFNLVSRSFGIIKIKIVIIISKFADSDNLTISIPSSTTKKCNSYILNPNSEHTQLINETNTYL